MRKNSTQSMVAGFCSFQFSLRSLLVALTLAAVALGFGRISPWWRERAAVSSLKEQVQRSKTSGEAGVAYSKLLAPESRNRIKLLANDPDVGIALKSTFELVADRMPGSVSPAKLLPSGQTNFLRALRKRTDFNPPGWWSAALLEAFP